MRRRKTHKKTDRRTDPQTTARETDTETDEVIEWDNPSPLNVYRRPVTMETEKTQKPGWWRNGASWRPSGFRQGRTGCKDRSVGELLYIKDNIVAIRRRRGSTHKTEAGERVRVLGTERIYEVITAVTVWCWRHRLVQGDPWEVVRVSWAELFTTTNTRLRIASPDCNTERQYQIRITLLLLLHYHHYCHYYYCCTIIITIIIIHVLLEAKGRRW